MLTFEDCMALCGLTEDEVAAIAEHEHIPEITALELGDYLVQTENGEFLIKQMILDDIEESRAHGNIQHAEMLESVLKQFVLSHPNAQKLADSLINQ